MKLSTVRVSQIFNTGAIHETDPEGEIERLLGEYFDELAATHCAAGPWRYDVENIEDDPMYLVEMERYEWDMGVMQGFNLHQYADRVIRFAAVPNPPQVKP